MYIHVRVTPKAKKESVAKITETEFEISVKEPAERNMANKRVRELLAKEYEINVANVKILTGHRSSSKILDIRVGHQDYE